MSLFQKSVLKKHLASLNKEAADAAWGRFGRHFLEAEKQENIRNSKEEQYQEGFLRELFVDVFGYVLNPSPGFNLTTELRNVGNAKKADGGILQGSDVLAVIELKGTETVDLGKVEAQAFGYKSHQKGCRYVLISNFEKLRLYIDDATTFEEFNLFALQRERFDLLYLLLAAQHLLAGLPARIRHESTMEEDDITKHFYKDYSLFKNALFDDLRSRNPQHDPLLLFKKSQKLLDRMLFVFFAEDKGLLPPNSITAIVEQWQQLKELDAYTPLYDRYKLFFSYINTGHKGKKHDIFAYNGGLFHPDELLDAPGLKVDDLMLYTHTLKMTKYDFESDVDVNILGHIFEHSLNEIEEITAQLEGTDFDKTKTKRKKDGVFYTPRYITQYIVENTVGKLCEEQKTALGIVESDYVQERQRTKKGQLSKADKEEVKALADRLDLYQAWLFDLKVCDPACGSGAFLNEAFDFLIREHGLIAELRKNLFGESIRFDVENRILEHNIYGVDINEEAVEIARLALWLRSAAPGRQLTNLSGHLKVGNSLIDDAGVAGDKVFKWEKEFPEVFQQKDLQAFHVVLTTHNSRTSYRMIKYHVHKGPAIWLTPAHELLLTGFIRDVIKTYGFKCISYQVCGDHVHLILVCEQEELSSTVRAIKNISSREFNLATGRTQPRTPTILPTGLDPLSTRNTTTGRDPLDGRSEHLPTGLDPLNVRPLNVRPLDAAPTTTGRDPLDGTGEHLPTGLDPLDVRPLDVRPFDAAPTTTGRDPLEGGVEDGQKEGKKPSVPFWSQKFFRVNLDVWELASLSTKPGYLYDDIYLNHAMNYVRNNRFKHDLPPVPGLDEMIQDFTCSVDEAFAPQYKGGFDVVVGNPPYVRQEVISPFKPFFEKTYKTYHGSADLFVYFIEKGISMLKPKGLYSVIVANKWMKANYGKPLRNWLKQLQMVEIIDFGDLPVFVEASTYPCIMTVSPKRVVDNHRFVVAHPIDLSFPDLGQYVKENHFLVSQNALDDGGWTLTNDNKKFLFEKIKNTGIQLVEFLQGEIYYGIKTGYNEAFVIDEKTKDDLIKKDPKSAEIIKPFLAGRDVKRYRFDFDEKYLLKIPKGWTNKCRGNQEPFDFFSNYYPAVTDYLIQFKDKAENRYDKGDYWWELRTCDYYEEFEKPKIIYQEIATFQSFAFDDKGYYCNNKIFILPNTHEWLLAYLNAKIVWFYLGLIVSKLQGGAYAMQSPYVLSIPLPETVIDNAILQALGVNQIDAHQKHTELVTQFTRLLTRRFDVPKLPQKLEQWPSLTYKEFSEEISKLLKKEHKRKLTLEEELEWEPLFESQRAKAAALQSEIDRTDREIDALVYGLYGLTAEEINIVEGG